MNFNLLIPKYPLSLKEISQKRDYSLRELAALKFRTKLHSYGWLAVSLLVISALFFMSNGGVEIMLSASLMAVSFGMLLSVLFKEIHLKRRLIISFIVSLSLNFFAIKMFSEFNGISMVLTITYSFGMVYWFEKLNQRRLKIEEEMSLFSEVSCEEHEEAAFIVALHSEWSAFYESVLISGRKLIKKELDMLKTYDQKRLSSTPCKMFNIEHVKWG